MSRKRHVKPRSVVIDAPESLPDSLSVDPVIPSEPVATIVTTILAPVYPCPICWPRFGGVGVVQTSRATVVYCKCNRCPHSWATTRKEGELVNVKVTRPE